MATTRELPDLIREFVDMSRAYMRQETVEPAKALGRFASFSIGAALAWALGAVLVAIAMMRALIIVLPDGPYWEALGYLLAALIITAVIAATVYVGQRGDEDAAKALRKRRGGAASGPTPVPIEAGESRQGEEDGEVANRTPGQEGQS